MKEYKGLYHNTQDKTKYFEYGAHFKYNELCIALKNLELKQQNEKDTLENSNNNYSPFKRENYEEIPIEKKRKKYKLKNLNIKENNIYLITDINKKDEEKNKIDIIEEEQDNKKSHEFRKKSRFSTKNIDKVHLPNFPNINSNSLISLQNQHLTLETNENNHHLHQSYDFHKKQKINLPKLNFLYKNNILSDNHNNNIHNTVETQNRFQDNAGVKIFNDSSEHESKNKHSKHSHKKTKEKIFPKLNYLFNDDDNEKKTESLLPRTDRKNQRLQSIFEKEKMIKNNNLFLGEKNSYMNKEQREIMNDHMAQQIHNLKKQLLGNYKTKKKHVYQ